RPDLRGRPHAAFAIEHGVMRIGGVVRGISPQMLVTPMQRSHHGFWKTRWNRFSRRSGRNIDGVRAVLFRIQNHQLAMSRGYSVDRPAGVQGWMVLVGGNLVVHEGMIISNVPQRYHDIALYTLRTFRRGRNFALCDTIRPV